MAEVGINKEGIEAMRRAIQDEFDRQGPIMIPVHMEQPDGPVATTINNFNAPVFQGDVNGAQLAWGNSNVTQNQAHTEQITAGFEELAQIVTGLLQRLGDLGLSEEDTQDATDSANEVLAEVVKPEPDRGVIRRALKAIKGSLASLAAGLAAGAASGAHELAKQYVETLGQVTF